MLFMQEHEIFSQEMKYLAVGLINTGGGLILIYLCMAAGLGDVVANLIGYAFGLILSFFLHGRWTFSRAKLTVIAYLANIRVMLSARDALALGSLYWPVGWRGGVRCSWLFWDEVFGIR